MTDSVILRHRFENFHSDCRWTSIGFILISIISPPCSVADLITIWLSSLPACYTPCLVSLPDKPVSDRQLEHLPGTALLIHLSKNHYGRTLKLNWLINAFIYFVYTTHSIIKFSSLLSFTKTFPFCGNNDFTELNFLSSIWMIGAHLSQQHPSSFPGASSDLPDL